MNFIMSEFKKFVPLTVHKPTTAALAGHYFACMMQRQSQIEVVVLNTCRYFSLPYHSMLSKDRMCNPEIDFPIAVSNYNAASGLACTKEEPSLGRASSPSDEAHLTGPGLKLLLLHHDVAPVKTEENPR